MNNYRSFSRFYDMVMGDRTDVIRLVNDYVHRHSPDAQTLLELGCGTGSILQGLKVFFEVEGVDISPEMLRIAHQKLPRVPLHQADIAEFNLNKRFDVVICVFDTINHLLDAKQWESTFRMAAAHLNDGGVFLFDTLTTGRLRAETVMPTYIETYPTGSLEITTTGVNANEVSNSIIFLETQSDGIIQVLEEELHEAAFPLQDVKRLLAPYFETIDTFTSDNTPPSDRSGRVYFVCRKL
jgi:SAM-dependent methyltransferase